MEQKVLQTASVTNEKIGETGGGVTVGFPPYKNAGVIVFPDIAEKASFKSATSGLRTQPSVPATIIHELLDHGLQFIRKGTTDGTSGPEVKNVNYQNKALRILNSPEREGHNHN